MATVTQQEVAPLHKQINITINKEDYLPSFEKALKDYSKKANIPGFRKGMVPAGLIRKMYGNSLFVDEVLRTVDREVVSYIQKENLDIFAQPIPLEMNLSQLDVNKPAAYNFTFEVGMKPEFSLPDLSKEQVKRYKIEVTDALLDEEIERLLSRYGNVSEPETITTEDNVLNVLIVETDAQGNEVEGGIRKENSLLVKYFTPGVQQQLMGKKKDEQLPIRISDIEPRERHAVLEDLGISEEDAAARNFILQITRIGQVEKRELNEEFFAQLFPKDEIKTEEAFREKIKSEMEQQWNQESKNQLHHQLYHILLEHTRIEFPEGFLKRWMKSGGQQEGQPPKTEEEVEREFPQFINQLKWTLISDKIAQDHNLQVQQDDVRQFAKQQLLGYMGMSALDEEQDWVRDYIDRMMKDRKYVEDAYNRLQTQKMFEWAESQVQAEETPITKEEFLHMNEAHQHQHHE